jgi:outer membrane murein-binding lipoprotein Lpp
MLFAVLLSCSFVQAVTLGDAANPIRNIVTLLQDMAKEIEAEGDKEQKAFDKFMCYCNGSTGDMQKGADEGSQKTEELASKLEALKAEKTQLEQELAQHKADRAQAKQDQEKAQSLRTKENGEFTAAELDMSKNIAAMKGALAALAKGLGAFVQMPGHVCAGAARHRRLAERRL